MWGGGDGGLCQPLTIAGSAMDDTGHRELWRLASADFPAGREVGRVAASSWGANENELTCYLWQANCWCLVWLLATG